MVSVQPGDSSLPGGSRPELVRPAVRTEATGSSIAIGRLHTADRPSFADLERAIINGESIKELMKQGANANAVGSHGETILHRAVDNGNFDAARILLDNGANPNATDCEHERPLHSAARQNDVKLIQLLASDYVIGQKSPSVGQCVNTSGQN